MSEAVPLFQIYHDSEDIQMVSKAIERGTFWALGPEITEFEGMLSQYVGARYALVFNSGTSALHAALLALEIGQGDEVIVPSFTFVATANAPLFVGAKPVFADIEDKTYGLDPEDVRHKISRKTKAIIPVHYGGSPCLINELRKIANDHGLILLEDAAESLGARVGGKKVGTFSDCAVFSFCANKVVTTGEGGAIVTDSNGIYERLRLIRSHGRLETTNYFASGEHMDYVTLGFNFRMSNITAALGIAQLKKIDAIIEMRRRNAQYMTEKLSPMRELMTPRVHEDRFCVYQMYSIRIRSGKESRDRLKEYLSSQGIASKVYFHPVHLSEFYRKTFGSKKLPVTEKISDQILTLPMYPALAQEQIDHITALIEGFFSRGG